MSEAVRELYKRLRKPRWNYATVEYNMSGIEAERLEAADMLKAQAKQIKDLKWSIDSKDREIRKLRVLLNENTTD